MFRRGLKAPHRGDDQTRTYRHRPRSRSRAARTWQAAAVATVAVVFGITASIASAANTNIVRQGEAPEKPPAHNFYFKTIQAAVNASKNGDWVLIEPGVYTEEVKVTSAQEGIHIRGLNRNTVILDGQNKPAPAGSNGIEIFKTNNVSVENLTVRNFDRAELNGPNGNEIWWNGGEEGVIGARGWTGKYLTAYDTGLNGGYGIFAHSEAHGEWQNIYASGFNDSGMYIGACRECEAKVNNAVMEDSALGYSGSNAGGKLVIEHSIFRNNSAGIAPNSENPGDAPPPQDGACNSGKNTSPTPTFTSTNIARCTIFKNNIVENNNNLETPANESAARSPWGVGVLLPGTYADLVENNLIKNNKNVGVFGFEYPNPFPPNQETIFFQFAGNKIQSDKFKGNGTSGAEFAGDVTLEGGAFGQMLSTNNCLSGNVFTAATHPANIEKTWGCQNHTTPNPEEFGVIEYILLLQGESFARTSVPQAAPPPQPTMPNACGGVPNGPMPCK
jgi:hypothetical protein